LLKRAVSGIILALLLTGVLTSAFSCQLSRADEAMHIKGDAIGGLWLAATSWNKTYGGTGLDFAYSVVQTSDGGYAIAGYTNSSGAGNWDFWLVKTDSSGIAQWNKTYGGTGYDWAYSMVQTGDGGYAIAGCTNSSGVGYYDLWLVKTDSSGNVQWSKTYGGTKSDVAQSVIQTGDGGYAIAGCTNSYGAGGYDFWLVKTDSSGIAQWNKTYGGTNDEFAFSLVWTVDGGYAITGHTYSYGAGVSDFWLVKTDSSGIAQWNKTYGGTNFDVARSVVQTNDGGYAITGYTSSYGAGGYDLWLVKTNSSGNMQWNKTYGGTNYDEACSVAQTNDGGYIIGGYTSSYGAGVSDFWLIKTNSSGNAQWNKTYGGTKSDVAQSLVQTNDGGYALAGYTYSYGAGGCDFWLVKLTPLTIYVRADGSVDPSTAPIQRNGDLYTLTDNIYTSATYGIVIERNNTTLDGAGYTLQGNGSNTGIYLSGRSNVTIQNADIRGFSKGVFPLSSSNNNIFGNSISNNEYGIYPWYCSSTNISRNNITASARYDIYLGQSSNNSISKNNIIASADDNIHLDSSVYLYYCLNTNISENTITASTYASILLEWSSNNSISGNDKKANTYYGILLRNSSNNRIFGNDLTAGTDAGIWLYSSSNNNIFGNNITNNEHGIELTDSSNNNSISGNNVTANSGAGIALCSSCNNNTISGNNATNNYDGIGLDDSANNVIVGNAVTNNEAGIRLHDSANNTISGSNITNNAYGIYLYSSSNNTMFGNNIRANNLTGILLYESSNYNNISGNSVTNNGQGITISGEILSMSSNNILSGNNITANNYEGIRLGGSPNNSISGNNITNNLYGILFDYSTNYTTVIENTIAQNYYGLYFWNALNNSIFHNNIVNNTPYQVLNYNASSINTWDDGYPSGGNYWSDYNGTDLYRGAYQNITGSDGIGDTNYTINANNTDHYPLMGSYGPSTTTGVNVTVFPTADVCLVFENVTAAGSTTVNRTATGPPPPPSLHLVGQYYDVRVTASYAGNVTIRIVYDDTNMTQQEESKLRLLQWCLDPCDITGATEGVPDDICDMRDIGYICTKFMTTPQSPDWNPRCDVSGPTIGVPDGIVDMRDIGFACSHFGMTSKWVNITMSIDTVNNLIFGETSHFSLIGIHRE